MSKKLKIALLVAGGIAASVVLAMVAILLFLDLNAHKPRLEAAASDALGMEVRLGGRMGIGFFPGFHVALDNVLIRCGGTDFITAAKATAGIELLPLLRKEVRIGRIVITNPRISVVRDRDGTFNFEKRTKKQDGKPGAEGGEPLPDQVFGKISLSNGSFLYTDQRSGERIEIGAFDLEINRLRIPGGKSSDLVARLSFQADFACKELRKGTLEVSDIRIRIEGKDGVYVIRPAAASRLVYSGTEGKVTADRLTLGVQDLAFGGDPGAEFFRRASFTGSGEIAEIRTKEIAVSGFNFSTRGKNGVLDIDPVAMRIFGGQGSGNMHADFSGNVPLLHVRFSLSKFRVEEFLKTASPKKTGEGPMDISADLSMRGTTAKEMKRTANGSVSLRGENLTLKGTDIDGVISRFEESQGFNIVDVGAYFFAGPFGSLLTKGYEFSSIYGSGSGSTRIRKLVSDWTVERGVAQAKDVAMATDRNRIALKGRLDFVGERFDDVTVALIDKNGCVRLRQKIYGPFNKPTVDKASTLETLAAPVLKLFQQTKKLLSGGKCEIFYAGSVAPPE